MTRSEALNLAATLLHVPIYDHTPEDVVAALDTVAKAILVGEQARNIRIVEKRKRVNAHLERLERENNAYRQALDHFSKQGVDQALAVGLINQFALALITSASGKGSET